MTNKVSVINTQESLTLGGISESLVSRWLKFAGVADKSVTTYNVAIKQLFKYFRDNRIKKPAREDLENWRDKLIEERKSPSTVALYITACKLFFKWLALEGIYPNVAEHLKNRVRISNAHKKDALSNQQAKELLNAAQGDDLKSKRDGAIIALCLTTGIRTIEVVRANVEDIRTINGATFLFVQGKGRYERNESVRLAPQVDILIRDYLDMRGELRDDEPLFTATSNRNFGKRLDTQSVRKMIKSKLRDIGLDSDKLTAHSLRHTAATMMLIAGVDTQKVQMILRHKSLNTTMVYSHAVERLKNDGELVAANSFFS